MSDCIEAPPSFRNNKGYGRRWYKGKKEYMHRIAFLERHGRWPVECRHLCDNPPCFNADHLEDGSHSENLRDCVIRGRHNRAILDEHDVVSIIRLHATGTYSYAALARAYGVSETCVRYAVKRKTWKWIQVPTEGNPHE